MGHRDGTQDSRTDIPPRAGGCYEKKIHDQWRYALVCERLRCEPWRPWGWGETTLHRATNTRVPL